MSQQVLETSQKAPEAHAPVGAPSTWRNPYRRLPRLRALVQGVYVAFFLLVGIEFYGFYQQAASGNAILRTRPPAVEAFLPISALMGLKRLVATGQWDDVHPAGLTILIAAIAASLLARKAFCSWICPVGGLSRALEWFGKRTIWRRSKSERLVPRWLDLTMSALKYLLLAFFVWAIGSMPAEAIEAFRGSQYNLAADAKMLLFFTDMSQTAALVLLLLGVLSIVVKNFWCRYLCPYGALLGLFSWASPQHVSRDASRCTDCKACTRACPVEIPVHKKLRVLTPECTGCMSCVAACPARQCLTVAPARTRRLSPYLVPVVGVSVILLAWGIARLTGHWHTAVEPGRMIDAYQQAESLAHP